MIGRKYDVLGTTRVCLGVCLPLICCDAPALAQVVELPQFLARQSDDASRLAVAKSIALKLVPPGTYVRMVHSPVEMTVLGLGGHLTMQPAVDLLAALNVKPERLPDAKARSLLPQVLDILDPVNTQRRAIAIEVTGEMLQPDAESGEEDLRKAMAQTYALNFSKVQLDDIARFLATSTGMAFAAKQLFLTQTVPVSAADQHFGAMVQERLPQIKERITIATAALPKPKSLADLTDADRMHLAKLLGVAPETLKVAAKDNPR